MLPVRQQRANQAGLDFGTGRDLGRGGGRDLGVELDGFLGLARIQQLLSHGDQLLDFGHAIIGIRIGTGRIGIDRKLRENLVERLRKLAFAARAGQVGHGAALEHGVDRGDRLDLELAGDELLFIDIDLLQHHALIGILRRDLFQHRGERLARAAPFGPEIEHHQLRHRRFDDFLLEAFDGFLFLYIEPHAGQVRSPSLSCGCRLSVCPNVGLSWGM